MSSASLNSKNRILGGPGVPAVQSSLHVVLSSSVRYETKAKLEFGTQALQKHVWQYCYRRAASGSVRLRFHLVVTISPPVHGGKKDRKRCPSGCGK